MNLLANNLRRLRLGKGLTQEQLASRLGVSAQSVSRWETAATAPDVMLLPEIARILGVPLDDLFRPDPRGYGNNARRLLAVYEHSHSPEDFLAAQEEFARLLKTPVATAEDWRCAGVLHEYMAYECISRATGQYEQAMRLSRDAAPELFHRTLRQSILLRCRIGQGDACVAEREAAAAEAPDSAAAWVDLAHACFFAGQAERALRICEEALERFPQEAALHLYAGDACRELKRYEAAFPHWERAVALDEAYLDALFSMAFCRGEMGQFDRAAEIWEDIARRLELKGLPEEAKMPRDMARKCRERS